MCFITTTLWHQALPSKDSAKDHRIRTLRVIDPRLPKLRITVARELGGSKVTHLQGTWLSMNTVPPKSRRLAGNPPARLHRRWASARGNGFCHGFVLCQDRNPSAVKYSAGGATLWERYLSVFPLYPYTADWINTTAKIQNATKSHYRLHYYLYKWWKWGISQCWKILKKILKLNSTMNLSVYWILVVYLYFLDIHTIQTLVIKKWKNGNVIYHRTASTTERRRSILYVYGVIQIGF